jgi:ZIP family zinc transporter
LPDFDAVAQAGQEMTHGVHDHGGHQRKLLRMGLFTALAIAIHNLPEGLATFLTALRDPGLGVAIAIAIALHNLPEGISVSVPIFYATGNRKKAFTYSFLSGLAEPVGAGIAYLALRVMVGDESGGIPPQVMGILFGAVAGIMVYINQSGLWQGTRKRFRSHWRHGHHGLESAVDEIAEEQTAKCMHTEGKHCRAKRRSVLAGDAGVNDFFC